MREKWPQGARPCPQCNGTLWVESTLVTFNGRQYPVCDRCLSCAHRGYVMSGIPERIVPRHEVGALIQKMLQKLKGETPETSAAAPTEGDF